MSKKSEFVNYVKALIEATDNSVQISDEAKAYWIAMCDGDEKGQPTFTDNGKLIMQYLQSLPVGTPMMKAKDIAEGMFISSRAVSGAMRKLVTDGFVEKIGQDPVMYALTDAGRNITIEE